MAGVEVPEKVTVTGITGDLSEFNGVYSIVPGQKSDDSPVWKLDCDDGALDDDGNEREAFFIYRDCDEHWWSLGYESDVEGCSGDISSEEVDSGSPVGLTYAGDYGNPSVQAVV
eukprot:m.74844 g.74844  ORF g.74844 m.74844 type:complete len:114 (-) comp24703_c0_seq1:1244-1585(-)